ncbi:uncharacterized protein LOC107272702 [Cephus cinctus]|uniref:Uncharacterized protein LOC107272702 n=1 Tax=Cephus cinctus TaxID=211228 RepID=A0AAJ7FS62_CEPCN|nr:uncharacterized protein LOC107272702 [Cephus cinctus]
MAKFFVLLAAFAAIVQISLASPTFAKCGCGSRLTSRGNVLGLGASPVSFGNAMAEERVVLARPLNLQPVERMEVVSSQVSPLDGMFNPSPYYRTGCSCGGRYRTAILPAAPSC